MRLARKFLSRLLQPLFSRHVLFGKTSFTGEKRLWSWRKQCLLFCTTFLFLGKKRRRPLHRQKTYLKTNRKQKVEKNFFAPGMAVILRESVLPQIQGRKSRSFPRKKTCNPLSFFSFWESFVGQTTSFPRKTNGHFSRNAIFSFYLRR